MENKNKNYFLLIKNKFRVIRGLRTTEVNLQNLILAYMKIVRKSLLFFFFTSGFKPGTTNLLFFFVYLVSLKFLHFLLFLIFMLLMLSVCTQCESPLELLHFENSIFQHSNLQFRLLLFRISGRDKTFFGKNRTGKLEIQVLNIRTCHLVNATMQLIFAFFMT